MPEENVNNRARTVAQFPTREECRTDLLPAAQIEVARRSFELFLERLSAVIPGYLFAPAEIRLAGMEQQPLSEALAMEETGGCTVWFALQGFDQRLRLDLGRAFACAALESVLGAPAEIAGVTRDSLTELDFHILRDLIHLVGEELRQAWFVTSGCPIEILSTELTAALEDAQPEDQGVVNLTAEIAIRECSGPIRLLVPSLLLRQISAGPDSANAGAAQRATFVQALGAASVEIEAVLDGAGIQFRDLLGLQPGKILELPHKADAAIRCRVNGVTKFSGELVSSGKSLGFQVQ